MSERVGVEQTPDIEAAFLAEVSAVIRDYLIGETGMSASGIHATLIAHRLAPVLAAAVREARAAELREAAEDWTDTDDPGAIYADNGDVDLWLRDRADRIDVDAPEGGASRG